jgi:RHS repeat-associated protein
LIEPGKKSNRLSRTIVHPNGQQPIPEPYTHDPHGNMTSMSHLQQMEWDFEDQLHHIEKGNVMAYYVYDATGERVRKVVEKNNNGALIEERIYLGGFEIYRRRQGAKRLERETLHLMDGQQRIALVETRTIDTAGNDPALPQLIRYQFGNHLGSACLELDDQAQIISYEEYYPYGSTAYHAMRSQTETSKRYRYTGKERDEESGLYYYGARYYAPYLCRWIAVDPLGVKKSVNVYTYVSNRPISFVDLDGRDETPTDDNDTVGKPGFGESLIPIWGSGRDAIYNFQKGNWGWGLLYTGLAVTDVFLVKALVTGIAKGVAKGGAKLGGKKLAARKLAAKELAAKELAAKELAAKELAAKELAAKELAAKELAAKELAAKEAAEIALKVTGKVAYGVTDLSKLAQQYRILNKLKSGNVAVFEYLEGGVKKTLTMESKQFVGHSERLIAKQLEKMGIDPKNVTRIYSELAPCSYTFGGGCSRFIQETFKNAAVTFSFEYGATKASREAGVTLLKKSIKQLFKPRTPKINLLLPKGEGL